jgi:hypothetical protein
MPAIGRLCGHMTACKMGRTAHAGIRFTANINAKLLSDSNIPQNLNCQSNESDPYPDLETRPNVSSTLNTLITII